MSKSQYVTLSYSIPIYNTLLDHLEKLLDEKDLMYCHSSEIRNAITKGYDKLKTYYIKTDDSKVYPIATSKFQHFKFIYLNFVLNLFKGRVYLVTIYIRFYAKKCRSSRDHETKRKEIFLKPPYYDFY